MQKGLCHLVLGELTRSLASAVDAKDPYTYGHSERVARIAVELGRELNLLEDELSDVYLAGLLHDVGKIGIRDEVLCKHGPLTPEETLHIQQHPGIGHSILKDLHQISSLLPGVLHHHERFDEAGYPAKLAGEQIPRIARILAVADSYDAMSTSRPYRKGVAPDRVEQILIEGSGERGIRESSRPSNASSRDCAASAKGVSVNRCDKPSTEPCATLAAREFCRSIWWFPQPRCDVGQVSNLSVQNWPAATWQVENLPREAAKNSSRFHIWIAFRSLFDEPASTTIRSLRNRWF